MLSMTYTISSDVFYFFKKQILNIMILCIFCAFMSVIAQYIIGPNINELYCIYQINYLEKSSLLLFLKSITLDQKKILLHILCSKMILKLINITFFYSLMLCFIKNIIFLKIKDLYQIIKNSFLLIPKLLPLIFFIFFILKISFIFFEISSIIFCVLFSLTPMIFFIEKKNLLESLKKSIKISWSNLYIILFPMVVYFFLQFFIKNIVYFLHILPIYISIFIFNFLNNINLSLIIIYLCRFYILNQNIKNI